MTQTYRLLIDGALVEGAMTMEVIDPATGATFAECARADIAQLDQAVAAARLAFSAWAAIVGVHLWRGGLDRDQPAEIPSLRVIPAKAGTHEHAFQRRRDSLGDRSASRLHAFA